MRTALHVLAKDVRARPVWLVVWALACLSPLAGQLLPEDAVTQRIAINTIGPLLRLVMFVVLVSMVVQDDPLVDSRAFWPTRPIGRMALLAGKLLFVGLVLVVPAVVSDLSLLAATGLGTRLVLMAVPEIVLEWSLWGVAAVVLSAFASTLTGTLTAGLKLALLWAVVGVALHEGLRLLEGPSAETASLWRRFLVALGGSFEFAPDGDASQALASMAASRTIALYVAALVAALGAVFVLYRTRRVGVAWVTIAVGLVAMWSISTQWRWNLLPATAVTTDESSRVAALAREIEVTIEMLGDTAPSLDLGGEFDRFKRIEGRIAATGVDPPLAAEVVAVTGTLRFADGAQLIVAGRDPSKSFTSWSPLSLQALLGGARFVNLEQERALLAPMLVGPPSTYEQHANGVGRLDADVSVVVKRYRIAAEMPLRVGARYDDGTVRAVTTATFGGDDGTFNVMFRDTQISLLFEPRPSVHDRALFFRFNRNVLYVLRNRERREAFWPQSGALVGFGWPSRTRVDEAMMMQTYRSAAGDGPPLPRIDDAWLAGADLVRVEAEPLGTTSKHLEVSDFALPGNAPIAMRDADRAERITP